MTKQEGLNSADIQIIKDLVASVVSSRLLHNIEISRVGFKFWDGVEPTKEYMAKSFAKQEEMEELRDKFDAWNQRTQLDELIGEIDGLESGEAMAMNGLVMVDKVVMLCDIQDILAKYKN